MTWGLWGIGVPVRLSAHFDTDSDRKYFPDWVYAHEETDPDRINRSDPTHTDLQNSWFSYGLDQRRPHIERGVRHGPAHPDAPLTATEKFLQNMGHEFATRIHQSAPTEDYIYRGMRVPAEWIDRVRNTGSLRLPLSSFDTSDDTAAYYARPDRDDPPGLRSVVLQVAPGAKSYPLIGDGSMAEHVTHGDFAVDNVRLMEPQEAAGYGGHDEPPVVMHLRQRSVPAPFGMPGPGERTASLHEPDLYLHPSEIWQYANPDNGFKRFTFPEFKQTVSSEGAIHEPVEVSTDGKYAYLTDGHHRVQAADELGLDRVPVRVIHRDGFQPGDPEVGGSLRAWLDERHHTAHRTAMPTWHHLTDDPNFQLDPQRVPTNLNDHELGAGVFLTQRPEEWAYDQWVGEDDQWSGDRPYIADIDAPHGLHRLPGTWHNPDALRPADELPGSDEIFVPADQFHHLTVQRVRPRTAMPAPMPEGITFHYHPTDDTIAGAAFRAPAVEARHQGKRVGYLQWDGLESIKPEYREQYRKNGYSGKISDIKVHKDYRRHGIATSMFDFAKQHEPNLRHSEERSPLGEKWVRHEQSRHAHRTAMPAVPHKDNWEPGEQAHYEYHCLQSPESSDYHLWQRSQQPVTVLGVDPDSDDFADVYPTLVERREQGLPRSYRVRFQDGHEDTAWEDELLTDSKHFNTQHAPPHTAHRTAMPTYYHRSPTHLQEHRPDRAMPHTYFYTADDPHDVDWETRAYGDQVYAADLPAEVMEPDPAPRRAQDSPVRWWRTDPANVGKMTHLYDPTAPFGMPGPGERTAMSTIDDYARQPRDGRGRILLHRGVGEGGYQITFHNTPDPTGHTQNDFHFTPPAHWDEAMTNLRAEQGDEGYGGYWGTRDEARFYAGDANGREPHGAMTVSSWWHPDDVHSTENWQDGLWVRPGAQGEVAEAHVYHRGRGWVPLPGSAGRTVTAHRTAMPWYHVSPHKFEEGDWIFPGGGESPLSDMYEGNDEHAGRSDHVWLEKNMPDIQNWNREISRANAPVDYDDDGDYTHDYDDVPNNYVYEVTPETKPHRWPDQPTAGWVTDSATVNKMVDDAKTVDMKKYLSHVLKVRTMTAAVTVYTKPSCVQCDMTKKLLERLGVEHRVIDVTADPDAHAYVTGLGYQQAPVVVVGDGEAHWGGFKVDRLKGLVSGE